jgi:signal-transduction protein with cAMP-binding, CBS, and nucleotidyltransferase domain
MTLTSIGSLPVSAFAADDIIGIGARASLLEVAQAMVEGNVSMIGLGGDNEPVRGVVSERDVVHAVAEGRDVRAALGGEVARTVLVWCDSTATVAEVAEEMMEHYVRHVLVEEEGRLVGVVSARDLLGAYVSADPSTDE